MTGKDQEFIVVGRISSPYGIKGWVKVFSYTDPPDNIFRYQPWYVFLQGTYLQGTYQTGTQQKGFWKEFAVDEGHIHGNALVAHIKTIDDRNGAERLKGCDIAITREQLPAASPGEYYWIDLIGSRVINLAGIELGVVDHLLETGANDVLVVRDGGGQERLIPFVMKEFIKSVDLENHTIHVDWDADF